MRESSVDRSQLPLTFSNNVPTSVRTSQFSLAHVVESSASPRSGLHLEFSPPTPSELIGDLYDQHFDDDERSPCDDDQHFDDDQHHQHHADQRSSSDIHDTFADARSFLHPDDDPPTNLDDHVAFARDLLQRDRTERRHERTFRRRSPAGRSLARFSSRRHTAARPRPMVPHDLAPGVDNAAVRFTFVGHHQPGTSGHATDVPAGYHRLNGGAHRVDTHTRSVKTFATGPLQGIALALYFVLLPYVIETKWRFSYTITDGALLRDLLVGLTIFWLTFLTLLIAYVHQLRHRRTVPSNGCAWLAGLVIMALPFLVTSSAQGAVNSLSRPHVGVATANASKATNDESTPHATLYPVASHHADATTPQELELLAIAITTKGRRDRARRSLDALDDDDLDDIASDLRSGDTHLIAQLRNVVGSDRDGEVLATSVDDVEPQYDFDPVVVAILGERQGALVLGYAREGGTLPIDLTWSDDECVSRIVALHDGSLTLTHSDNELMRALARRRDTSTIVVYLGNPSDIDDELRELCVTVRAATGTSQSHEASSRGIRVELLRAFPRVSGLVEDFTPSLRRRCLEMVAYLAMHGGEPVTGDRLRTRVLLHANVDASKTTLTNTASAVRRSLGSDAHGYLLEPVSSGLYHLRAASLDVAEFHQLVARSRHADDEDAYNLFIEALRLVHGEPLASVLKGFEWFSFEGHRAQLQRDGEWVALALHNAALLRDDVETAFWSLRQGLLLDPDSEELLDALERVPRLRQFGGNGPGATQHQSVSPSRAVAMSWAFERFGR